MRVIILSKAPVAGKVKTRLMSKYSAEQAAELHVLMLDAVLSKVCSVFDDVWLAVDDMKHNHFKPLQAQLNFKLVHQGAGDLGNRLTSLMRASFAQDDEFIMFLGTDSPHVDPLRYQKAQKTLATSDIVIGPVEDGGYDLIAMRRSCEEIFKGVRWGSDSVFNETTSVIHKLGLSVEVLETSFDLDRPEDLERAPPNSW